MVRESQIKTAAVNVEHVLQIAVAHRGAFDMPARTARAERGIPARVERIGILRRLPQREIARIMLVGGHVGRVDRIVLVVARVVDGRAHRVGHFGSRVDLVLLVVFALLDEVDHVDHVAGGARLVRRRLHAKLAVRLGELAFVDIRALPPLLARGGGLVEDLVVDVGDIAHERHLVAQSLEPAAHHVERDGGADVADMR